MRSPAPILPLLVLAPGCLVGSPIDDTGRQRARASTQAAQLCAGLPAEEIERTLADHPSRILEARPITRFGGHPHHLQVLGAEIVLEDDLGLPEPHLETLFACQAARYAAGVADEVAHLDPLAVEGIEIRAQRRGDQVLLRLLVSRSGAVQEGAGTELVRRARALLD